MAYAGPAVPLAALTLPLYVMVPTFYTEALGLPLAATGAALLLIRLFDAVNDPVVGYLADHVRPRFGRRRSFFAAGLVPTALAVWMLFNPPATAGITWLASWSALLSLGYTLTLIPYTAWGAELSTSYGGRSRVAAWRESLTLTGTLLAVGLPFSFGPEAAQGWHGLAVLAAVLVPLLALTGGLCLFLVPEPVEYSVRRLGLREGAARLCRNRPFLRLIAAFFLNGMANGIPATLFLYFVSDVLAAPALRGPLLFLYFLSAIAGVPLAARAAARVGKHRAWCLAMGAACVVFALAPLLGPGDAAAFALICLLTGLLLGFDIVLPPAIQADVIDVDTAASGEQRSGLYFSAWSLATKLSLAAGVGLVFPLLARAGFEPQAGASGDTARFALAALYAWLPVGLKLAAVTLMWSFPVGEREQAALRLRIEAARRSA